MGQACSYKIWHIAKTRARDGAKGCDGLTSDIGSRNECTSVVWGRPTRCRTRDPKIARLHASLESSRRTLRLEADRAGEASIGVRSLGKLGQLLTLHEFQSSSDR